MVKGFKKVLRRPLSPVLFLSFIIAAYAMLVCYSLYWRGSYNFHDLGLINDWFANIGRGKPFYVSEYQASHLGKHFTPSLLLLFPFYLLTESQFILILLGSLAFAWTFVELVIFAEAFARAENLQLSPVLRFYLIALSLFFTLSTFHKTVLASAHFEIFFIPIAIKIVRLFLEGAKRLSFYGWLVLAIGIRQDAAIFLGSILLALSLYRGQPGKRFFNFPRLAVSGLISLIWLFLAVKVFIPLFGTEQNVQLWQSWGQSWPEIFLTMVSQPKRLLDTIAASGFMPLMKSMFFSGFLSPLSFLIAHAPSLLIYTVDDFSRYSLKYYNSAFMLPSCFIFGIIGGAKIAKWTSRLERSRVFLVAMGLFFVGFSLRSLPEVHPPDSSLRFTWHAYPAQHPGRKIFSTVRECEPYAKLATDSQSLVYTPLSYERFLLHRWENVDLVAYQTESRELRKLADNTEIFQDNLKKAGFVPVNQDEDLHIFVAENSRACANLLVKMAHSKR